MEFRIADTFTNSLAKLAGDKQKAVKTAAFDLQVNLAHPSLQFHKLETHPKTGAAQFVEVRETVQEILVPKNTPKC